MTAINYIDSTWTDEQVENEYLDTSSYDVQESAPMCRRFITACRALLIRRPVKIVRSAGDSSQEASWDVRMLKEQMEQAQRWLAYSPAGQTDGGRADTIHPDLSCTRDYGAGPQQRNYGTDV